MEEKPSGYQSSEYKDTIKVEEKFNDPVEGYHQTESIMKDTPSHGTEVYCIINNIRIFSWKWFW
jgi:hypothetical protein